MPTSTDEQIEKYFDDRSVIPDYQREFAWHKALSTRLFDSLDRFLQQNPQKNLAAGQVRQHFYLGTIMTVNGQIPYPIVDGQQRLTAISITAAVLRDYLIDREEYDAAYDIDQAFVWWNQTHRNRVIYDTGQPRIELRDTGTGMLNLRENMRHICSLELPDLGRYEVTGIRTRAGEDYLTLDNDLKWRLPVFFQISFDTANVQQILAVANLGSNVVRVNHGSVAIGDFFNLSYGQKNGDEPSENSLIQIAYEGLRERVSEVLDERYPRGAAAVGAPVFLPDINTYVDHFIDLIKGCKVTQVEFDSSTKAMQHFLIVNDSTLQEPLTDLDRLRALSEIVGGSASMPRTVAYPGPLANWGAAISAQFLKIEDRLLNRREKNQKYQKDFFYQFAQAYLGGREANGIVLKKGNSFLTIEPALKIEWSNIAGEWRQDLFFKFLEKIEHFVGIFFRAEEYWTNTRRPGATTPARVPGNYDFLKSMADVSPFVPHIKEKNEEFYLAVLKNSPYMQWQPTYMAGNYVLRRACSSRVITEDEYEEQVTKLLKSLVRLHVFGQIIPEHSGQKALTGSQIYGLSDSFCTEFKPLVENLNPTQNEIIDAIDSVSTRIQQELDHDVAGLAARIPARAPLLPRSVRFTVATKIEDIKNNACTPLLMLAEWAERGYTRVRARNKTAYKIFNATEVEHIQPKKEPDTFAAAGAAVNGWTARGAIGWKHNMQRLGNRLLISDEINGHVKAKSLSNKKKQGGCRGVGCNGTTKHYKGSNSEIVKQWFLADGARGWFNAGHGRRKAVTQWGDAEIDKWERFLNGKILQILP